MPLGSLQITTLRKLPIEHPSAKANIIQIQTGTNSKFISIKKVGTILRTHLLSAKNSDSQL